jgi:LmbE family N-acetylglucosaminyl deacetylase
MSKPLALFVLAHQDDEYAINSRIRYELRNGNDVVCVFLTDGAAKGVASELRNQESTTVLESYGVSKEHLHFLGTALRIGDGTLMRQTDQAAERLHALIEPLRTRVCRIFTLAWEGGHADHDACHLVALDVAGRLGMLDMCREFPVYTGFEAGPLFRVMKPIRNGAHVRKLSFGEGLRSAFQCWRYPSQYRTWAGLFPEAFVRFAVLRREQTAPIERERVRRLPHSGVLLYERMFGVKANDFMKATYVIRERILRY